jgi:hypothetical protein
MAAVLLCVLLAQASPAPAPRLEDGIRQVEQGDFEAAVTTLRAVVAALAGDPLRSVQRARAHLHLGVAHVALGQAEDAHRAFLGALRDDPRLRLTDERFSPKVVAAFEAARREARGTGGGGGSTGRIVGAAAAGAAVAAGAVIALGIAGESLRLVGARFVAPVIQCPDDSNALPIPFAVLADIANDGGAATILAVTTTARIEASDQPEIGFTSIRDSVPAPVSLAAGRTTTVRVDSTLLCFNGPGGPPRANEWTARLTITTSAGTIAGQTPDRMRVEIP